MKKMRPLPKLLPVLLVMGITSVPFSGWPPERTIVVQARRPPSTLPSIVKSEFLFVTAPFASAHASTIVETREGLVAAWFGGTREGVPDVSIWLSRRIKLGWTTPIEVATGSQPNGVRYPCWNPVLFQMDDRTLMLFYKIGPNPASWFGAFKTSRDSGRTWSNARRLPPGILGPDKNKPAKLADGSLLSPSGIETHEGSQNWFARFERTIDNGRTWTVARPPISNDGRPSNVLQPSILIHSDGRLQAVGRSRSHRMFETWSHDNGKTWTPIVLMSLPNPNSGIDALTLRDGRHLIVYNHTIGSRSPLNIALSRDGKNWEAALVLESGLGEYSYPAVIQASDGFIHITYTWNRQRIKHVAINPKSLVAVPMPDDKWPAGIR